MEYLEEIKGIMMHAENDGGSVTLDYRWKYPIYERL